ncbi:MAG: hypothetical protein ACTSQY_03205 [Candidatus Odinarchaeia archaeon]
MEGQPIIKKEWKQVVEELKIIVDNNHIALALSKAQLEEAKKHI